MARDNDSYLEIAETVLREVRMPLSARQIISIAYGRELVPVHLHGRTQHKTLGARLSEDILERREASRFFRTRPGRFFLTSLISDDSLPIDYRTSIVARRRRKSLKTRNIACLSSSIARYILDESIIDKISCERFSEVVKNGLITYSDRPLLVKRGLFPIYAFVILRCRNSYLVYSPRPYASGTHYRRDELRMGFPCPLVHDDLTLFDQQDHGAVAAGLASLAMDLDLEYSRYLPLFENSVSLLGYYVAPTDEPHHFTILAVTQADSPPDFLPRGKRLSVGNLTWMTLDQIASSLPSFDRWTQFLFAEIEGIGNRLQSDAEPALLP